VICTLPIPKVAMLLHWHDFPCGQSVPSRLQSQMISRDWSSAGAGAASMRGTMAKRTAKGVDARIVNEEVYGGGITDC
jgi:hypothetical protein